MNERSETIATEAVQWRRQGSPLEVLWVATKLGLTSFGGPIAHLGYFHEEYVRRRKWIDDQSYADLMALCQFAPGPTSSKMNFSLGLMRAGYLGGLLSWVGFTLPSALALLLFAYGASALSGPVGTGVLHGLKLVAVVIVAQAVWGMAQTLCPDRERASIAGGAALIVLLSTSAFSQLAAILFGAFAGAWLCRRQPSDAGAQAPIKVSPRVGVAALTVFFGLLFGLPLLRGLTGSQAIAMMEAFYRSGALVFGGGHVVLPLLQGTVVAPGWVDHDAFLAGYGAAQAVPGPLFTFAAYLGAVMQPEPNGLAGAALGLTFIFLPGILLHLGTLPFWESFRRRTATQAVMRGINAGVVGLLGAALYDPIWTSSVQGAKDFAVVLVGFVLLMAWKAPPVVVVIVSALGGALFTLL
ncbi:MAG TPA: chromate efflux transporter [Candidatus Eisenbacteria bacterium]|nr:chromate efflux transporter [Candidatus Eisenbacteria bacterium]